MTRWNTAAGAAAPDDPGGMPFPMTDLQAAYMVGASPLMELGGFPPTLYYELDVVDFDPARAEQAVRRLIERHEQLRTVMLPDGEQRVLHDSERTPFRLRVTDLRDLPPGRREAVLADTRTRMRDHGPSPSDWPLFEITALRLRRHRTRLYLAMSLLLLDAGSTRRLQEEWWQLYQDPDAALPPVATTYREAMLALAAKESSAEHRAQAAYWEQRYDTLPEAPRLPGSSRASTRSPAGMTRRAFFLGHDQWQRLRTTVRAHRILPTAALLHVYAEVLGAWADEPRFCLNVLHQNTATRHPEAENVVGILSATLPLEVDLTADGDFWERGVRLQKQLWRDMRHSDVTGVRIAREVAARRGWTSRAALPYVFNSMLSPEGPLRTRASRPVCRTVHTALRTPQVLIDNQTKDAPDGGIECVWDTVDEAFPPGLPDALFDAYRRMVESLAAPGGPRTDPDPVPPGHLPLVESLNRPADPPYGRLEDGFLQRAHESPGAPAVLAADRMLTYGQVEEASRAVALRLRACGIGREDVVPVVMAKGWEQVVGVLAVLRAGAAYCPVDAGLPEDRIRELLDRCAAPVVLGQSHTTPRLTWEGAPAVCHVDEVPPESTELPDTVPASSGDLAYVIYTSGSTGRPKGVMTEHSAAVNTVAAVNERLRLGPDDRVFGISSLSFDLSVWDVFGSLAAGAALVLPRATPRPDPLLWARTAAVHGVTVWNSVPALAEMLVEVAEHRTEAGRMPIRAFLLSGDWVPVPLPERMRALWPSVRVTALGGATEASIWSNAYEIDQVGPGWESIPYGFPLRGQTMRVLDHRMRVRPPWATGRLYIGGAGLARGYAGDEERTAERFIRHPGTGERLYWSGDLGRYRLDGGIEFRGREDRQLKIQGFRVEPGEVESALRGHPKVADCAVCAVPGPGGQPRLAALAVPLPDTGLPPEQVASHLRSRLPSYMVPGIVRVVPHMPLTANGKVDAAMALTEPAGSDGACGDTGAVAAGGADEVVVKQLALLWRELLGVDAGTGSDFFDMGGNSLLALRLVNRVRSDLGFDLSFGQIFETPTLGALAGRMRGGEEGDACAVTLSEKPGTELFLFHPVGGSVTSCLPLARAWPGPVKAFQSHGLLAGPGRPPASDLTTMATAYREELQQLTPEGPYVLGGWSMGGVLAQEVARQLTEAGHRCRVFMIDSSAVERRSVAAGAGPHLEFLKDLAGGRLPDTVAAAVRAAEAGSLETAARDSGVQHGLLPAEVDQAGYERLMQVHAQNLAALAAHRPARPAGRGPEEAVPTLLFAAGSGQSGVAADQAGVWQDACPGIEVVVRPQHDHYSIVGDEESAAIAEHVTAWLETAPLTKERMA